MLWHRWLAPTAVAAAAATLSMVVGCSGPVSKFYEIHTGELSCEQANRHVHDTMVGMKMVITGFKLAKPGSPGYVRGKRTDERGVMKGEARIRCSADGVHITTDASGAGANQQEFERGIYLGVTGRANLIVQRKGRESTGVLEKREPSAPVVSEDGSAPQVLRGSRVGAARRGEEKVVGVLVVLEPVRGFATVLDFEADLSAAGILPVKVTIKNGTKRAYEFDPGDIALREAGSRRRAYPLTPSATVSRLRSHNRRVIAGGATQREDEVGPVDADAPSELGDVGAASRIILARKLRGARLRPGDSVSGFLYYEVGNYDRARVTMIDDATGETEGFIVEF